MNFVPRKKDGSNVTRNSSGIVESVIAEHGETKIVFTFNYGEMEWKRISGPIVPQHIYRQMYRQAYAIYRKSIDNVFCTTRVRKKIRKKLPPILEYSDIAYKIALDTLPEKCTYRKGNEISPSTLIFISRMLKNQSQHQATLQITLDQICSRCPKKSNQNK